MKLSAWGAFMALTCGSVALTGCEAEQRDFESGEDAGAEESDDGEDTDDTDESDTDEVDSDATDTGESDTDEVDSDEDETDEADTDEADTDEADTDEADTDEADTDEGDTDESDTDAELTDEDEADAGAPDLVDCEEDADCDDENVCNGTESCVEGECRAGDRADNGTECEIDGTEDLLLCIDGNCVVTACGDGFVDERTDEVCDDGNAADGDGCEVGCTYSCNEDADCDDSNVCNGDEVCDTERHACGPGEPAEDGTSCGDNRECIDARCIAVGCGNGDVEADLEEVCDDGNLVDGDGCDSDCTPTCLEDADCDDGDVCNGAETCNTETNTCAAGEELTCDDEDECTDNACDPVNGCFYPLIDSDGDGHASRELGTCGSDCDDNDPDIHNGAAELCDGKDNNCNGDIDELAPTWYVDCDGDTFAEEGAPSIQQCEMPGTPSGCDRGLVATWTYKAPTGGNDDCYDQNADAYPRTDADNATAWKAEGISARPIGVQFDYNCDDEEEPRYTKTQADDLSCSSNCVIAQPVLGPQGFIVPVPVVLCCVHDGWIGSEPAECGESAAWSDCTSVNGSCGRVTTSKVQECR